jgi:hypothetical protein
MHKATKTEALITVGIFLSSIIGLCAFSIFMFTRPADEIVAQENRLAAPLPKLRSTIKSFREAPALFEKYFVDRFAFRSNMVYARNALLVKAFAVSPSTAVLVGKDNWLYYMIEGDAQTIRHAKLYTAEELKDWRETLEQQRRWLARRGIKYAFVLAPSKCSIYPEYVPDSYYLLNRQSRADQLVSYLRDNSSIDIIDLRAPLISKKSVGQLYFRTDTHWNKLGAMLASSFVINHLRPILPNLPIAQDGKEFTISTKLVEHGDLVRLMGVDGLLTETQPVLSRKGGEGWKLSHNPPQPIKGDPRDAYKPLGTQCFPPNDKLPKAVFLGDSFSVPLVAYLAPNFSRIYLGRDTRDPNGPFLVNVIKEEKPDIVMLELTERKLMLPVPKNPAELCQQLSQSKPLVLE